MPDRLATLDDLLALPVEERERYELIEGVLVERGAATEKHERVKRNVLAFVERADPEAGEPDGDEGAAAP
jgi:Uma2 family endonuclease